MIQKTLLCFGLGYSAEYLARALMRRGFYVIGTTRDPYRKSHLERLGVTVVSLDAISDSVWEHTTHILSSVPPVASGDPVLALYEERINTMKNLSWSGYFSTTGVYGDYQGAWVDETSPTKAESERATWRLQAEKQWRALKSSAHIFRLAGIYGPKRSVVDDVIAGTARRIVKEGQVFSRVHVADIAQVVTTSITSPRYGEIYNVCDDEPAPAHEVVSYACEKLGMSPPPLMDYRDADLSQMAREFYASNRRVSNRKIREELGVKLLFPTYRHGIDALIQSAKSAD